MVFSSFGLLALFIRTAVGLSPFVRSVRGPIRSVGPTLREGVTCSSSSGSFDEMKGMDERLTAVQNQGPATLGGFYDDELKSFAVVPGTTSRFSVTSTCFALQAILSGPKGWKTSVLTGPAAPLRSPGQIPLKEILTALASAEWRSDDLFQLPIVLITLLRFDATGELLATVDSDKLRGAIEALLEARPRRRYGRSQPNSAYTQFWLVRAMLELLAPPGRVSDGNRFYFELDASTRAQMSSKIPDAARSEQSSRQLSLALSRAAVRRFACIYPSRACRMLSCPAVRLPSYSEHASSRGCFVR